MLAERRHTKVFLDPEHDLQSRDRDIVLQMFSEYSVYISNMIMSEFIDSFQIKAKSCWKYEGYLCDPKSSSDPLILQ